MTEKPSTGHFDNAWINVDETDDPNFFVRFLDDRESVRWNSLVITPKWHLLIWL